MKKDFGLFLVALFLGIIGGIAIGIPVGQNVFEKNFSTEIPDPLASFGLPDSLRIQIFFEEGKTDKELHDKIYDLGDAFHQKLVPAVDKFRRYGDDTDLLILKARVNGNKEMEYRLLMRDKWLKGMAVPRPSTSD